MFKFLAIALCLALGAAEEEAAKDKVGDVIGIDLGTTYSCGERADKFLGLWAGSGHELTEASLRFAARWAGIDAHSSPLLSRTRPVPPFDPGPPSLPQR